MPVMVGLLGVYLAGRPFINNGPRSTPQTIEEIQELAELVVLNVPVPFVTLGLRL